VKEPGGESSRGQNGKGAKKPDTLQLCESALFAMGNTDTK